MLRRATRVLVAGGAAAAWILCATAATAVPAASPLTAAAAAAAAESIAAIPLPSHAAAFETAFGTTQQTHTLTSVYSPISAPPPPHRAVDPRFSSLPQRTLSDILDDALDRFGVDRVEDLPPVPASYDPRFDPRYNSSCPSLFSVRDQGNCGADWASSVVSALSDRICMENFGSPAPQLAIEDVLSCCGWECGMGCSGGYASAAWEYLHTSGVVSGGDYNTSGADGGCYPYSIPPCNLMRNGTIVQPCDSIPGQTLTPVCTQTCQNNGTEWEHDKYCSHRPYALPNNSTLIETELFYNGPVTATMDIFQDFPTQIGGAVYSYSKGHWISALSFKIIGYGVDNFGSGLLYPYWLATNSWGRGWGGFCPPKRDMQGPGGFFKVRTQHAQALLQCETDEAAGDNASRESNAAGET